MAPQAFALRPVRLSDLPTLKRWRSLPDIQRHLRHPHTSWWGHWRWWWGIRKHQHPTRRVWAVTLNGKLVGQVGLYYKMAGGAEVSVLVMREGREDFIAEREVVQSLLTEEAKRWGVRELWAEVLSTAPIHRHYSLWLGPPVFADTYSTLYRWRIA